MVKNVFVLGLTPMQQGELSTVHHPDQLSVHGLLDYDTVVGDSSYDFGSLLGRAREQLDAFDGTVDASVSHWDFHACSAWGACTSRRVCARSTS